MRLLNQTDRVAVTCLEVHSTNSGVRIFHGRVTMTENIDVRELPVLPYTVRDVLCHGHSPRSSIVPPTIHLQPSFGVLRMDGGEWGTSG